MNKPLLVAIDACVREGESRTRRIAEPILEALAERYSVVRIDLPSIDLDPLNPKTYSERAAGNVPINYQKIAALIAKARRIVIVAPFLDMSFPAVLKCFIEQVSLFGITFEDNGTTCVGLCKHPKVLYITTRGMDIKTGSKLEQATPYIKALAKLWNLGGLTTIAAQNMDYSTPEEIESKISACIAEGLELAKKW